MRSVARSICVVVLALTTWVPTMPAVAKGPTDVAVEGPGVDVHLTSTAGSHNADMEALAEAARVYDLLGRRQLSTTPKVAAAELGPRYVLSWTVGGMDFRVQHAYPFAVGGPWIRFLPTDLERGVTISGWVRAPALRQTLVSLGAIPDLPKPTLTSSDPTVGAAEEPTPASADEGDTSSYHFLMPAGVLLAVAVVVGVIVARRRRLSR
ncbi:hypothetical protein [Nocardioides bizhenqiangii]|uniref:Gram-positive cocci surface proteins LPxTG domain-containing protein n=1 Tax=Nocardioides bizhenqiangii TaxID=3095076 RepID=A0ABZ0ZUC8_9ACTN|nr:hypothetical protein [Nocardioides sp. HM61]WQQ27941.1 hypothetical protein SHK19_06820 [Nocardioides sp. HM61]